MNHVSLLGLMLDLIIIGKTMSNKNITELIKDLKTIVDSADIANETIRNGGICDYAIYNMIIEAEKICIEINKNCYTQHRENNEVSKITLTSEDTKRLEFLFNKRMQELATLASDNLDISTKVELEAQEYFRTLNKYKNIG